MRSSNSRSEYRAGIATALAACFVVSLPATVSATNTVNSGGSVKTGSLSAKLLSGAVSANTPRRQSLLICDPDRPYYEISSVYYDRFRYEELGLFPRVTVEEIRPGPGYEILEAVVQVQVGLRTDSLESSVLGFDTSGQRRSFSARDDGVIAYQTLDEFRENPLGRETGFVQMQVRRFRDDAETPEVDESETGRYEAPDGFTFVDADGITDGPNSVDTHAWFFRATSTGNNDADVVYEHLATKGLFQDLIIAETPEGEQYVVDAENIDPAIVRAPEPASAALLAIAAVGLLGRPRRPR